MKAVVKTPKDAKPEITMDIYNCFVWGINLDETDVSKSVLEKAGFKSVRQAVLFYDKWKDLINADLKGNQADNLHHAILNCKRKLKMK